MPVTGVLFASFNEVIPLRGHHTHRQTGLELQHGPAPGQISGSGDNRQHADLASHTDTVTWELELCWLSQESCPKAVQKPSCSTEAENKLPQSTQQLQTANFAGQSVQQPSQK